MSTLVVGDYCEVVMGQAPPGSSYNDGSRGLPLIAGAGDFGDETPKPKKHTTLPVRISKAGDIILCIRATIGDRNWSDREYCLGRGVAGIRPDERRLDRTYLWHWLGSQKDQLASRGTGSTFKQIGREVIESFPLPSPLPALPEQRRIAAILDKVDVIRRKRQQALATADELLWAAFLATFGDPVLNPLRWPERALSDVAEVVSGVTKGRRLAEKTLVDVPYMRVANVQDGHIDIGNVSTMSVLPDEVEKYCLQVGDLLLTEGGDPDKLGRGAVWRGEIDPCIHQNHIFRVRLVSENLTPVYLSALIASARGKRYFLRAAKQTTGIATINSRQLKAFPVLVPPLDLQRGYQRTDEKARELLSRLERSMAYLNDLFGSLSSRAFREGL